MSAEFGFHTTGAEVVAHFTEHVTGRTFMITGPTPGGIGAATALALAAAHPGTLVLAGRSEAKISPLVAQLRELSPSTRVEVVALDLGSLASVRAAARAILDNPNIPRVDVLINNAGIMACPRDTTADGLEAQFGTNHIGHFLLTGLLRPKRVVSVSSSGHMFGTGDYEDYNFERTGYDPWFAYGQSKIANILFARALAARGVEAFSLHPGSIASTNLGRHLDISQFAEVIERLHREPEYVPEEMATVEQGCATQLRAALDPTLTPGSFLMHCKVAQPKSVALDPERAEKLMKVSEHIVGEAFVW